VNVHYNFLTESIKKGESANKIHSKIKSGQNNKKSGDTERK